MQTNVLGYLEETVQRLPDKTAFADDEITLTFKQFYDNSRRIGSFLAAAGIYRKPVLVYMKRSPVTLAAFFGVIYAGCYYVPIDEDMPQRRIELIIENTQSEYMICDADTKERAQELAFGGKILEHEMLLQSGIDEERLGKVRAEAVDTDPVYVLFTSGSTGIPKGVVGHHRAVIDYIESLSEVLGFSEDTVFGNQTPLYLDACMKEVYPTMKYGATTWLIPKQHFMFPVQLVTYLNEHKINTICWVVSALTMISAFGTFDVVKPEVLHTVAFGSEVFPVKQFNLWKTTLPEAKFFNLYGPTEATGMSCYYPATRLFGEKEVIPVGKPFKNTQILLLDEDGNAVPRGETGEICIRGTCLTHGYYNNPEKTKEAFTQNPQNPCFPDRIYHTGDLGRLDENGDLLFVSRRDYQIKHMGHRIELGEIEADVALVDRVKACCCIFMKDTAKIVLFYTGDITKGELTTELKKRLPRYMIPNAIMQLESLPLTPNGKMDRLGMEEMYRSKKGSKAGRKQ